MTPRPVPTWTVAAVCVLLLGTASVMTIAVIALTADGPYNLVRLIADEDVYAPAPRYLGSVIRQTPVLLGLRAGSTDTHLLSILLGVGYLLVPAAVWSLAIVLARTRTLVFAAVTVAAGLCAVATWFCSVSESVLALAVTALLAVLLSRATPWSWGLASLATIASVILIASYETAIATAAISAVWAFARVRRTTSAPDRVGGTVVAIASVAAVGVALSGSFSGQNDSNSRSFMYFVVSLEPPAVYVLLLSGASIVAGLAIANRRARSIVLVCASCASLIAAISLDITPSTAYAARGAAVIAVIALQCFLAVLWHHERKESSPVTAVGIRTSTRWQLLLPAAFVAVACAANLVALGDWSRGLRAFRAQVTATEGLTFVDDALAADERGAVWGWTATSLSLIARESPTDGVLVDRKPSWVPFPPEAAGDQVPDSYAWRR
jgi:hypothetical protein